MVIACAAYTKIYGLWLTAIFLRLPLNAREDGKRFNILLAALALASVVLGHPDRIIHLLMADSLYYESIWLVHQRGDTELVLDGVKAGRSLFFFGHRWAA